MKKLVFLIAILLNLCILPIDAADVKKVDLNLKKNEIAFTFFDLSSGEATLIQTGTGKNILINTGAPSTSDELLYRLEMYDVLTIDQLILTNLEKEYCGNVLRLTNEYSIDKIVLADSMKDELLKSYPLDKEIVQSWKQSDLKEIFPNFMVKVLHTTSRDEDNTPGMVILFYYGSHQVLYMGHANSEVEKKIIDDLNIKAKILKVGEFAVKGTSQYFLENLNPQVAIIFHRKNKLPTQEVIERLNETWIDIYQTRQFGNVTIKCDPQQYEVITIQNEN